jgi:hypothetical protein
MKGKNQMSELQRQAVEQAITTAASKTTYTGAAMTGTGWALSNEFIALGGFALAVLGYLTTLFFKLREDRRQQRAHEANMQEIKGRREQMADAVSKEVEERLSRAEAEGYGGMPRLKPKKPAPVPTDEPQGDEQK